MPAGRPTIYTPELANLICDRVASCITGLNELCKAYDDMPSPDTIYQWRHRYKEFSESYLRAREHQAHFLAEQVKDIAEETKDYIFEDKEGALRIDSGIVALQKFRMTANTWLASRIKPSIYGDKQHVETTVKHEENLKDLE